MSVSSKPKKKVKSRFGFTIDKDLTLLKSAVQHNPYQLGEEKWDLVVVDVASAYINDVPLTKRTIKTRIHNLLLKFHKQQLSPKSGTEIERSERGILLQEIASLVAESSTIIETTIGDTAQSESNIFTESEVLIDHHISQDQETGTKKQSAQEKKQANEERDLLLESANSLAADQNSTRRKRLKLSQEDEMIIKKLDHDMKIESARLDLERDKLELEKKRESRMEDENRRRDELASNQIKIQNQMLAILSSLIPKPN